MGVQPVLGEKVALEEVKSSVLDSSNLEDTILTIGEKINFETTAVKTSIDHQNVETTAEKAPVEVVEE